MTRKGLAVCRSPARHHTSPSLFLLWCLCLPIQPAAADIKDNKPPSTESGNGRLTFYRDEFFCFTDPYEPLLNYHRCCVEGDKECWVKFAGIGGGGGGGLSFERCCWDTPLYTQTIDCESAELSYCLGKLGMAELLLGSDVDAFFDGKIEQGQEQPEKQEDELVNLGLKLNQACLRGDATDGETFGIEKMSDPEELIRSIVVYNNADHVGTRSREDAISLWDIARYACETWQNVLRKVLMPLVQALYGREAASTTREDAPLSKLDKMNIQTLTHDYRAHTWEATRVEADPYAGDLMRFAAEVDVQNLRTMDESGKAGTKADLGRVVANGVVANAPAGVVEERQQQFPGYESVSGWGRRGGGVQTLEPPPARQLLSIEDANVSAHWDSLCDKYDIHDIDKKAFFFVDVDVGRPQGPQDVEARTAPPAVLLQFLRIFGDHEDRVLHIRKALHHPNTQPYIEPTTSTVLLDRHDVEALLDKLPSHKGSLGTLLAPFLEKALVFGEQYWRMNLESELLSEKRSYQVKRLERQMNEQLAALLVLRRSGGAPGDEVEMAAAAGAEEVERLQRSQKRDFEAFLSLVEAESEQVDEGISKIWKSNVPAIREALGTFQEEFAGMAMRIGDLMDSIAKVYYERLAPLSKKGCEKDLCDPEIAQKKVREMDVAVVGTSTGPQKGEGNDSGLWRVDLAAVADGQLAIPRNADPQLILPVCPALLRSPGLRMAESHLWPPPLRIPRVFAADLLLYGKATKKNAFYMQKSSSDSWARRADEEKQEGENTNSGISSSTRRRRPKKANSNPSVSESKWDRATFDRVLRPQRTGAAAPQKTAASASTIRQRLRDNLQGSKALAADYALDVWTDSDLLFLDRVNQTVSSYQGDTVFVFDAAVLRYRFQWAGLEDVERQEPLRLAILGSEQPWMELVLLYRFAGTTGEGGGLGGVTITTVDYRKPSFAEYPHPQWRFKAFHELLRAPTTRDESEDSEKSEVEEQEPFDAWFSYSSIEHAGLGRYGEPLNPFADVQTMGVVHCHTKTGGYFFLGPACLDSCGWLEETTSDTVYFNAGRDYGRSGWARLLMSWALDLAVMGGGRNEDGRGSASGAGGIGSGPRRLAGDTSVPNNFFARSKAQWNASIQTQSLSLPKGTSKTSMPVYLRGGGYLGLKKVVER
eukprot:g4497.t1